MKEKEVFDAVPYKDIRIKIEEDLEVLVSGDAAGSFSWEGSELAAVYERGSGGMMLEPEERPYPVDLVINGLTEVKAQVFDSEQPVELTEDQELVVVEHLNNDLVFIDKLYESIQADYNTL